MPQRRARPCGRVGRVRAVASSGIERRRASRRSRSCEIRRAAISTLMPDWFSAYSSSRSRYAGLMLTRMAPTFAAAYCVITHSAAFGLQMPTRSPRSTPSASSARAARFDLGEQLAVGVADVLMTGR